MEDLIIFLCIWAIRRLKESFQLPVGFTKLCYESLLGGYKDDGCSVRQHVHQYPFDKSTTVIGLEIAAGNCIGDKQHGSFVSKVHEEEKKKVEELISKYNQCTEKTENSDDQLKTRFYEFCMWVSKRIYENVSRWDTSILVDNRKLSRLVSNPSSQGNII